MNTRTKRPSPLRAALGGAGLARTGALLALALGAAQAGATTYTVPLQFNITLAAPVCTLTVGGITANSTTPTPTTGVVVDLTPTPISVIGTPVGILGAMSTLTTFTADAPGLFNTAYTNRRVTSPPAAAANCSLGTPMTLRVTKGTALTNSSPSANGMPGIRGTDTLPIAMSMGIASFGGTNGTNGQNGTTWATNVPAVSVTGTGADQTIALTAAMHASSTTPLTPASAGTWQYPFNVNLDF